MDSLKDLTKAAALWAAMIMFGVVFGWLYGGAVMPKSAVRAADSGKFGDWLLVGMPMLIAATWLGARGGSRV